MAETGEMVKYNGCFSGEVRTEEQAYWLGFLAGDGCVTGGSLKVSLKDREHLVKLSWFLGYAGERVYEWRSQLHPRLEIGCVALVRDLIEHGIIPRKTNVLDGSVVPNGHEIPFIRGLVDADGTIGIYLNQGRCDFRISLYGTYALLQAIQHILACGGSLCHTRKGNQLKYGGRRKVLALARLLYRNAPIALERKEQIYKDMEGFAEHAEARKKLLAWREQYAV